MKKQLYIVYQNHYIEDYCLVYASTELEVVSQYCEESSKEMMTLDEFYSFEKNIRDFSREIKAINNN